MNVFRKYLISVLVVGLACLALEHVGAVGLPKLKLEETLGDERIEAEDSQTGHKLLGDPLDFDDDDDDFPEIERVFRLLQNWPKGTVQKPLARDLVCGPIPRYILFCTLRIDC